MKKSRLPLVASHSSAVIASEACVPVGFHPLSEKMIDVLVVLQEKFLTIPDWWRQEAQVREMAMKYYKALRRVLRTSRPSERRLTRCCQCEIFF